MRNLIIIISAVLLFGCTNDETNQVILPEVILPEVASKFKVIITEESNTISTVEYGLDSDGKVLYANQLFPLQSNTSIFKYDNQGRVTKEIRNNGLYYSVIWNGNIANLYDNKNQKIADFTYSNNLLTEFKYEIGYPCKYYYDSNDNVIAFEENNEVKEEYLDFDISVSNPMSLIKSIEILRLSTEPLSKNFFQTKKVYPYDGGDYFVPLTYYHYQKTVNAENKIISVDNDQSHYVRKFEYN